MESVFELQPIDGRKSFNSKCRVIKVNNDYSLMSYNTIVATYKNNVLEYENVHLHSVTTKRHIKAFEQFIKTL